MGEINIEPTGLWSENISFDVSLIYLLYRRYCVALNYIELVVMNHLRVAFDIALFLYMNDREDTAEQAQRRQW